MKEFNLKDWDQREPISSDTQKPWGQYYVFQDFSIDESNQLPKNIVDMIHSRFKKLLQENPELESNTKVNELADDDNLLINSASADEKILVVQPKQEGYEILSMQYHGREDLSGHIEIWEFLTDGAVVIGSNEFRPFGWKEEEIQEEMTKLEVKKFKAGEFLVVLPGQWHALAKPTNMDYIVVREWRVTPESNKTSKDREENIVRTYDNAGRGILGEFPDSIMSQL